MVAVRATSGSVGLENQITQIEKRILDRQRLIRHYVIACRQDLWNSLTSPSVLLSAGAIGFVLGTLARRQSSGSLDGLAAKPAPGKRLDGVLKCIAMIRTFLPTLRFATMWLFPQPQAPSRGEAAAVDPSALG